MIFLASPHLKAAREKVRQKRVLSNPYDLPLGTPRSEPRLPGV